MWDGSRALTMPASIDYGLGGNMGRWRMLERYEAIQRKNADMQRKNVARQRKSRKMQGRSAIRRPAMLPKSTPAPPRHPPEGVPDDDPLWQKACSRFKGVRDRHRRKYGQIRVSTIDTLWIYERFVIGTCEVTKLPFVFDCGRFHAQYPEIDRVDPTRGYSVTNSRMICRGFNQLRAGHGATDMSAWNFIHQLQQIGD